MSRSTRNDGGDDPTANHSPSPPTLTSNVASSDDSSARQEDVKENFDEQFRISEKDDDSNRKFPPRNLAANEEDKKSSPTIIYDLGKVSSVPPTPNPPKTKASPDDTFVDNVPIYVLGDDENGAPLDIEGGGNIHDRKVTTGIFPDVKNQPSMKGYPPCIGATTVPRAFVNMHSDDDITTFDDSTSRNKKDHHPSPIYDLGASSLPKRSMKISKRAHSFFGRIPAYSQDKKKTATSSQQLNARHSLSYSGKGDKGENVNNRTDEKVHALEMTVESQKLKIQELEEQNNLRIQELENNHDRRIRDLEETYARKMQQLEASQQEMQAFLSSNIPHGTSNSDPPLSNSQTGPVQNQPSMRRSSGFTVFQTYQTLFGLENNESLENDTFTLMMVSRVWSRSWALGTAAFVFQIVLGTMIAFDQISLSADSSIFSVPFKVDNVVRTGQFFSLILCLSTQSDILTSVQSGLLLGKGTKWDVMIGETGNRSTCLWLIRVVFPNVLKFCQGLLVMFVSFVIIVQSDNIIDLLKDFTALMVLSKTDNILFYLARNGYLGQTLMAQTAKVADASFPINEAAVDAIASTTLPHTASPRGKCHQSTFCIRYLVLLCLFLPMLGGWIAIIINQRNGKYFRDRYPKCNFTGAFDLAKEHFGDGSCYGGPLNSLDCAFEGGDCIDFNIAYPLCKGRVNLINVQSSVGNGTCEELFMIPECDFDGEDCCPSSIFNSPLYGDGQCHGGLFTTPGCLFDNGDCKMFNAAYPQCPLTELDDIEGAKDFVLGDNVCDGGIYSSVECGWENGDCDVGQVGQDLIADHLDNLPPATLVVGRKQTMGILSAGTASVYHYNELKKNGILWEIFPQEVGKLLLHLQ